MSVDNFWYDVMGHGPPWVPTHFLALGSISDFWGYQMLTWITEGGGGWRLRNSVSSAKHKTLSAFAYLRQASKILGQGQLHHVRLCHFVPEEIGLHLWLCVPLNQENLRIVCSSLCELSKSAGPVE